MIGIVIINYNTYDITFRCVDSIIATTKLQYRIYILDNASQNESWDRLNEKYCNQENIRLIRNEENQGYARGNNLCIRIAYEDKCISVIISNNDIIFLRNAIEKLHQSLIIHNECLLIGPKVYLRSENNIQTSIKKEMPSFVKYYLFETYLRNLLPKRFKNEPFIAETFEKVFWVSGCCFIIDLEKFKKIKFFDENTFLYFEEYILSFKARQFGMELGYEPTAQVIHYHGASSGGALNLSTRIENFKSEMYFIKNYWKINKLKQWLIWKIRYLEVKFNYRNEINKQEAVKYYKEESKKIYKK